MKRKFMALLISFSMIFSAMVSIPAKVFAEGVDIPSFADFGFDRIRHEAEAARLQTVAVNRQRLSAERLLDKIRNDAPVVL